MYAATQHACTPVSPVAPLQAHGHLRHFGCPLPICWHSDLHGLIFPRAGSTEARASVTLSSLSSRWHSAIHPHRTDRLLPIKDYTSSSGHTQVIATEQYLPAALQLAPFVTSSLSSHICSSSNHLDRPFPHLGPFPKHFMVSLAQSPKSLSLHPVITPMSLSWWCGVCNDSGSLLHWLVWQVSHMGMRLILPLWQPQVQVKVISLMRSLEFHRLSLLCCVCGNEPLIMSCTIYTKILSCVIVTLSSKAEQFTTFFQYWYSRYITSIEEHETQSKLLKTRAATDLNCKVLGL